MTRKRIRHLAVKRGSVTVKIYPTPKRTPEKTFTGWTVVYYEGEKRVRVQFGELKAAKRKAAEIANRLSTGEAQALKLTGADRHAYIRASNALRPLGLAVDLAALQLAEAHKFLPQGASLVEAAKEYARRHGKPLPRITVKQAVTELIESKRKLGMSTAYASDLNYRCGRFAAAKCCEALPIKSVTAEMIRTEFLDGLELSPRSYNNFVRALGTLFEFAKSRGYLARDFDEISHLDLAKERGEKIEIFTADEMANLMSVASSDDFAQLLPLVAIGAFAGLRTAEILRLDWSEVRLRDSLIEVTAGKAKTASRRLVPILPNLSAWLSPYSERTGKVWPHGNPYLFEARARLSAEAKVPWKANALRHSFISYRLAEVQNVNQVAMEAGNSAAMIFEHYRELVRPADAKVWFAIAPKTKPGVVAFEKPAAQAGE